MTINDDYLSSNYNSVQEIQIVRIVLPESSFYVEKPNQISWITLKEFALEIALKHQNVENILRRTYLIQEEVQDFCDHY